MISRDLLEDLGFEVCSEEKAWKYEAWEHPMGMVVLYPNENEVLNYEYFQYNGTQGNQSQFLQRFLYLYSEEIKSSCLITFPNWLK